MSLFNKPYLSPTCHKKPPSKAFKLHAKTPPNMLRDARAEEAKDREAIRVLQVIIEADDTPKSVVDTLKRRVLRLSKALPKDAMLCDNPRGRGRKGKGRNKSK